MSLSEKPNMGMGENNSVPKQADVESTPNLDSQKAGGFPIADGWVGPTQTVDVDTRWQVE